MGRPRKATTTPQPISTGAGIYLRVSTDEQATSGLGIGDQLERCRAAAVARGWTVAPEHIYRDEGISGTIAPGPKRPGLAALLEAVKAGAVRAVIVLDLSRLARSVKLVLGMIDDFDQAGIAFVSCKENFDTSTAMGRAMVGFAAVLGQLERDLTSERTRAALGERGRLHGYAAGPLPLGYRREAGRELIEVDEQGARIVRAIFQARADRATMAAIAQQMNEQHPRPGGVRWHASTVKTILDNAPRYRGERPHWPAVL